MLNPRLKSSKKWTAFPKEYTEQIESVFRENFGAPLKEFEMRIEGRIYQEEILLRVGLYKKGQLRQANFEVSMDYSPKAQDAVERIYNCIDAAGSMVAEYLENEDFDFPRSWEENPFQNRKVYLQFTSENSDLEAQANELLGESSEALIHDEESEAEDALERAEVLPDEELKTKKKNHLH